MVFLRNVGFCFSILQEAVFDKSKGTVCLKTFNLYKKILTFSKGGNEQGEKAVSVVANVVSRQKKCIYAHLINFSGVLYLNYICFQICFVPKQQM